MTKTSLNSPSERDLLWAALDLPPEKREKFLQEESKGDTALLDRLLALVQNAEAESHFMAQPAVVMNQTAPMKSEVLGTRIGRYKLMEQVGEGGMGIVYVAEQTEPVRRTVALKLIKPGMDTKQVIARFEAERQALALMDHPNIARVIDAGTTDRGLPYFVMELVRGLPITEYCDKAKLSPKDRLQLFTTVCSAVQHAHLKGIIHRDLKPNNILVTLHDGVPVVKVIDFGVAKALHQQLTQHTIYTALHQVVGTPLYMSPEQLELSGLDIDTRTDIYSLGVLLYELLTGVLPFDRDELYKSGFDEMRRIIREQDPPRPSQRITTLDPKSKSTNAVRRGLDDRSFSRVFRGELDWIVMKALEKDRDRRYESASSMAADVQRHLRDEPIEAKSPTFLYLLRKAAQKNKRYAYSAAIVLVALIVATAVSLGFAIKASIDRDRAKAAERIADEQQKQAKEDFDRAMTVMDTIVMELSTNESAKRDVPTLLKEVILEKVIANYAEFARAHGDDVSARHRHAKALLHVSTAQFAVGEDNEWLKPAEEAIQMMEKLVAESPDDASLKSTLYDCLMHHASNIWGDKRISSLRRAWEIGEPLLAKASGNRASNLLESLARLSHEHPESVESAKQVCRRVESECVRRKIPAPPSLFFSQARIADAESRFDESFEFLKQGINRFEEMGTDPTNPHQYIEQIFAGHWFNGESSRYSSIQKIPEAEELYYRGIALSASVYRQFGSFRRLRDELTWKVQGLVHHIERHNRHEECFPRVQELANSFPHADQIHQLHAFLIERLASPESRLFEALEKYPWQPAYLLSLRHQYAIQGEEGKARDCLRHLRGLVSLDSEMRLESRDRSCATYFDLSDFEDTPREWRDFTRRAHYRLMRRNYEGALSDCREAMSTVGTPFNNGFLTYLGEDEIAACPNEAFKEGYLEIVNEVVDKNKLNPVPQLVRSELRLLMGKPNEKHNYYSLVDMHFHGLDEWLQYTILGNVLLMKDDSLYKKLCKESVARRSKSEDAQSLGWLASNCSMAPNAIENYDDLVNIMERVLQTKPKAWMFRLGAGKLFVRAGRLNRGLEVLRQCEAIPEYNLAHVHAKFFIALALHGQGKLDESRAVALEAIELANSELRNPSAGCANDRFEFRLLKTEVSTKLGITAPAP